ncbi:MAG: FAD-binding oxidoreductase [bacterium]|nr:FAD-binding oxidoreductase [bacterium]
MRVTGFPKNDHSNGWYNILEEHPPARVWEGEDAADWVVIGGGFAGLAAARRLGELRPGDRVVLLEAGRIGENASGRNSGFIIDLPHALSREQPDHDRRQIRINRQAIAWLADLVERHQIRCQWSRRGKVHVAATSPGRRNLDVMQARLGDLGEDCERWDRGRLAAFLGTDSFVDGLFTPGSILMQPAALVTGLARSMPDNVEIFENSAVRAYHNGTSKTLVTSAGRLTAPRIILATNGWTSAFGFLRQKLLTIHTFASLTRPLDDDEQKALGGDGDWGTIPALLGGTTMRYTRDKRLLIRLALRHRPDFTITERDLAKVRSQHVRSLSRRFPMVPRVTFEHTWSAPSVLNANR